MGTTRNDRPLADIISAFDSQRGAGGSAGLFTQQPALARYNGLLAHYQPEASQSVSRANV